MRIHQLIAAASVVAAFGCAERPATPPAGADTLPSIVDSYLDSYLDGFARRHPSIAAGNGLHDHDDALEDFSADAIKREVDWLRSVRARLDAIDPAPLTPDGKVDRRILQGVIDGWLLDLDAIKNWTRNPMIYAAAITDGVHNLMTMESSPASARARQVAAKLRQVPRLLASARVNLHNPPRTFVERAIVMFRGAAELLARDLPAAFAALDDRQVNAALTEAADAARAEIDRYAGELETAVLPQASGSFATGTAAVEARYRAEELIDLPAAALLAIGERELQKMQGDFQATAARVDPSHPGRSAIEIWRGVLADHPKRGELVAAAQRTVEELFAFIRERRLVDVPDEARPIVAPALPFDLGLASMHSSPPLEALPVKSFYYLTDASAEWPPERQDAWLQKFNYATLADISAHEVAPGHFVHSVFMRRTPGKIRRIWIGLNPFPQPSSGQDGWAHYGEQLISDEGFKRDDPRYRLAQISEALTRICRLIAGVRLHSGAWTIDQAAQLFERDAHLPAPAARQEAVRGTYDPTYGGYFLGKMAALALRRDYAAAVGDRFSLREFHERVMTNGIAPWWVHRQLLLPGDARPVVD